MYDRNHCTSNSYRRPPPYSICATFSTPAVGFSYTIKESFSTLCALVRASFCLQYTSAHQSHPRGAFLLYRIFLYSKKSNTLIITRFTPSDYQCVALYMRKYTIYRRAYATSALLCSALLCSALLCSALLKIFPFVFITCQPLLYILLFHNILCMCGSQLD